jgi:hypothetical protein
MALLGGFEHQTDTPLRSNPDVPTLRVRGLALLGGVEVQVRLPGETIRQAKRRRRLERRGERPRLTWPGRLKPTHHTVGRFAPPKWLRPARW